MEWAEPQYAYSGVAVTRNFAAAAARHRAPPALGARHPEPEPGPVRRRRACRFWCAPHAKHLCPLAVRGSPHIDARDTSYQFALGLGAYEGGELTVEEEGGDSIAVVETRGAIARVDGRHVHWVRTHRGGVRFSLIFYDTAGRAPLPRGAAVDAAWVPHGERGAELGG
eukprot:4149718-Prymnesium_polylepis.1